MSQNTPTGGCIRLVCIVLTFAILFGSIVLVIFTDNAFGLGKLLFGHPAQAHPQVEAHLVLADSYSVVGMPSLSPSFINTVLARAGSPAQGTGQSLYDLSKQYRIDDAYALAVFQHESQYGRSGMARATHSLGNIRCSAGYRCIGRYRAYRSWVQGYADWYAVITHVYVARGLTTIPQIIPVYAPASDGNNVSSYIADVERSVARWQKGVLA